MKRCFEMGYHDVPQRLFQESPASPVRPPNAMLFDPQNVFGKVPWLATHTNSALGPLQLQLSPSH